ncbi:hypothetical protein ACFLVB_04865 [Chloroflexota bacterium]
MEDLFMIPGWGSPIGLGIFLFLPGGMIFIIGKTDEASKRAKQYQEDNK